MEHYRVHNYTDPVNVVVGIRCYVHDGAQVVLQQSNGSDAAKELKYVLRDYAMNNWPLLPSHVDAYHDIARICGRLSDVEKEMMTVRSSVVEFISPRENAHIDKCNEWLSKYHDQLMTMMTKQTDSNCCQCYRAPGGAIEPDFSRHVIDTESDLSCLMREMREEIGLPLTVGVGEQLFNEKYVSKGHAFLTEFNDESPKPMNVKFYHRCYVRQLLPSQMLDQFAPRDDTILFVTKMDMKFLSLLPLVANGVVDKGVLELLQYCEMIKR